MRWHFLRYKHNLIILFLNRIIESSKPALCGFEEIFQNLMKIFLIRHKLSIKKNLTYDKIDFLKRHRIRQKIVHAQNQKLFLRNWRGAERRMNYPAP
jgi:hypothetical protein